MLQPYKQSHNTFLDVCVGYHSFHLNSESSAALSLCPGHHTHTLVPTLILSGRCEILWWNATSYTLCRPVAIFVPTDSRGDAIFFFFLCSSKCCTLHAPPLWQIPETVPRVLARLNVIDDVITWWGKCVKRQGTYVKKLSFNSVVGYLFGLLLCICFTL